MLPGQRVEPSGYILHHPRHLARPILCASRSLANRTGQRLAFLADVTELQGPLKRRYIPIARTLPCLCRFVYDLHFDRESGALAGLRRRADR